jgi:hypothetical protein
MTVSGNAHKIHINLTVKVRREGNAWEHLKKYGEIILK